MDSYFAQNGPLEFEKKLINSAGTLAFSPHQKKNHFWKVFDAFISNPISFRPRKAATKGGLINYPGGALFHNGYPNPGFRQCLNKFESLWANAAIPIIPSLIENEADLVKRMARQLEEIENVLAINLLIGEDFSRQLAIDLLRAAQGELPIIASIAMEDTIDLSDELIQAGAAAIALSPSRGSMKVANGEEIRGRLYGPGQFPRALYIVEQLADMKIPVIGGNGVFSPKQAQLMLDAGAIAVQLDSVLWRADWDQNDWQMDTN